MKGLSKLTGLMLILLGAPLLASAQPRLSLGSATGQTGGTASMALSLSGGTENYAGVTAKIVLPEGVTLSGVTRGALLSTGFTINSHGPSGTVIAYSDTGVFSASSGVLLTLDLYIGSEVAPGNYDVGFADRDKRSLVNSEHVLSNADGSVSVAHDTYAAPNNLVINKTYTSTLYVSANGNCGGKKPCYFTIQAAVNAASTGSVIMIAAGTYDENITLSADKSLTLIGSSTGATTLRKAPKAPKGSLILQMLTVKP